MVDNGHLPDLPTAGTGRHRVGTRRGARGSGQEGPQVPIFAAEPHAGAGPQWVRRQGAWSQTGRYARGCAERGTRRHHRGWKICTNCQGRWGLGHGPAPWRRRQGTRFQPHRCGARGSDARGVIDGGEGPRNDCVHNLTTTHHPVQGQASMRLHSHSVCGHYHNSTMRNRVARVWRPGVDEKS